MYEIITNYDLAKEKLTMKAIPASVERTIGRVIGDIALVPYVLISQKQGTVMSTAVTPPLLETWGVSEEEVINKAWENTIPKVDSMRDLIGGMIGDIAGEDDRPDCYVVTTNRMINGASAIFKDGVADLVCERSGDDRLLIAFTSIHECICHPASTVEADDLKKVVSGMVDGKVVAVDEFLTMTIYEYDKRTRQFTAAA